MTTPHVPFFRVSLGEPELAEVLDTLRSGWLTTGAKVQRFEADFAAAVGARHAVAVNSCTAALHLAVEAMGLSAGQGVLVPTMTFAATAEIVRFQGAIPILVDCDPATANLDFDDAGQKVERLQANSLLGSLPKNVPVVGILPVHVGGLMLDIGQLRRFCAERGLWAIEDAAHSFPAAWRPNAETPWQRCGEGTSAVTCFSFYANKTITTGEGGMAVTDNSDLAARMRLMSLHGLSQDAWGRYSGSGSWDYRIIEAGNKYNMTDIAAAIGIHQLARAEQLRRDREQIAHRYFECLGAVEELELPARDSNRIHSWHLFPVKLRLEKLKIDRNAFLAELKARGISYSVHWRPLHLHPYYQRNFGWRPEQFPVASAMFERLVSLPFFAGMTEEEISYVIHTVRELCHQHAQHN